MSGVQQRVLRDGAGRCWGLDVTGQGRTLVLLHGFPFQRALWQPQLEELGAVARLVAVDLPGFGASDPLEGEPTMDRYAGALRDLLGTMGVERCVLVGHSMGGYVGLAFARLHPDVLDGLVLVASRAGADSPEAVAGRLATLERLASEPPAFLADTMAGRVLPPSCTDAVLRDRVRALMEPLRIEGIAPALRAMAARPDATDLLAALDLPVLVAAGQADGIVPLAEARKMAASLRRGSFEAFEGAGHMPGLEQPAAFNGALRRWLARL